MKILAADASSTPAWDWEQIYKILSLGITGLIFLLAALAFWLLQTQRNTPKPSSDFLKTVRHFMIFALAFGVLDFLGEIFKEYIGGNESPSAMHQRIEKLLADRESLQAQLTASQTQVTALNTLGEVWKITGDLDFGLDPLQNSDDIQVTAHPPAISVDTAIRTFETKVVVPRNADGSLEFPVIQICRPALNEACTIGFEQIGTVVEQTTGTIKNTGDPIAITITKSNHQIAIKNPINLPAFRPKPTTESVPGQITKIGVPKE